jgi:hypothetical protein
VDNGQHNLLPGTTFQDRTSKGIYTVEVLQALPTLRLLEATDGKFVPELPDRDLAYLDILNPAVQLRITSPSGEVEERWVLEADFSSSLPIEFSDLKYTLQWDHWGSPAKQRYMLMLGQNNEIWWGKNGEPNSLRKIEPGSKMKLGAPVSFDGSPAFEEELQIVEAVGRASSKENFIALDGADFFDASPGAALVEFTYPGENGEPVVEELWLRTKDGNFRHDVKYIASDGEQREAVIFFYEQTRGMTLEWQSKLTLLEKDSAGKWQPVETGTIRVNDYLHFRGYRFFQTNHNPSDPTYSGIGVVYDPGIEIVLIGFYLVMGGAIVVFLIKPLFTKRHRAA